MSETLKLMTGDIFTSKAQALVNPVNCVGVMGKGLALEFKKRFPGNYERYKATCDRGLATPGIPMFHENDEGRMIVNFPTKNHWRDKSRIEWIVDGLMNMVHPVLRYEIKSIAFPMLGCGLGGLREADVIPLLEKFAADCPEVEVELWRM